MEPPPNQAGKPVIVHPPPSAEALANLAILVQQYKDARDEIGCYIYDLTVEAQNNLLSGLFERCVPQRKPLDPKHKVITTETEGAQALVDYFERETLWGRHQATIHSDVVAEVRAKSGTPSRL
jgi:hypothetical protein